MNKAKYHISELFISVIRKYYFTKLIQKVSFALFKIIIFPFKYL